jgi:ADP-ribose pyrophosphatase
MNIELIESREIYQGRVFSLKQETLRLPNGVESPLDIIQHHGAVVIVPVDETGNLIMIRQYRHAARKTLLEFPAGGLEPGEDPETCARRELREEIGHAARTIRRLGGFFLAPGYSTEYLHIFLATELFPAPLEGDQDELIEVTRLPLLEILQRAAAGGVEDAKSLACLFLYQHAQPA